MGGKELLKVFLGSSIRSELCGLPLSVYFGPNLHRLSNSECFLTQFLCFYVGIHLLVQQPGINHRCVNQVTENSKIPFSVSHLHVKSHYVNAEQVNISHEANKHRHINWVWYFHMLLFLSIKLPHLWFGQFTNKCRNASNIAVIFKYKTRNITRINICWIFLWKKKKFWLFFLNPIQWEIYSLVVFFIVQYQYNEFHSATNTQKVAVTCNIYQNTICNWHHLVSLWKIKSQCCHCFLIRFLRFLGSGIILWPTTNFSLVSKAYITTENKKFVSPLVKLVIHVWLFHVISGLCCTYLFIHEKSFPHGNWQNFLFR